MHSLTSSSNIVHNLTINILSPSVCVNDNTYNLASNLQQTQSKHDRDGSFDPTLTVITLKNESLISRCNYGPHDTEAIKNRYNGIHTSHILIEERTF